MEIAVLDKETIRIKGKNASFIIDPTSSISKTSADAIIFLTDVSDVNGPSSKVSDARVIIKGPGSYEIGGVRISGTKSGRDFYYSFNIDGLAIFIGIGSMRYIGFKC